MLKKSVFLFSLILIFCLAGCVSQKAKSSADALIGWWKFDEGSGTTIADSSGKSVSGELTGEVVWDANGKSGSCVVFDGKTCYAWIDGSFSLSYYTMTIWFKAELLFRHMDIISAYAPGVRHGVLLEVRDEGVLRYLHRFPLGESGGTDTYSPEIYNDSTWHHAAIVKSKEAITLYVDGVEQVTGMDTSEISGDAFGVVLGALDIERTPDRLFKGALDDFRIYDTALSPEEIQNIMNE